jgi:hypothetical protein
MGSFGSGDATAETQRRGDAEGWRGEMFWVGVWMTWG